MRIAGALAVLVLAGCGRKEEPPAPPRPSSTPSGHERMVALLADIARRVDDEHYWIGDREARELRSRLNALPPSAPVAERWFLRARLGVQEGWLGNFEAATKEIAAARELLPQAEPHVPRDIVYQFFLGAGLVWMRLGEVQNCVARHSSESCILPIRGKGVHAEPESARRAIAWFTELAERFPERHAPRWLLNIATMAVGGYPAEVPPRFLVPPKVFEPDEPFPRLWNVAARAGVDTFSLAGGAVADDFDGDGRLDLVVSSWDPREQIRLFRNTGKLSFADATAEAGLRGILGGANLVQADYDNDGHLDVLVLRGTWLGPQGRHPKSLLRNLGNGRFTDVTFEAGLGEALYPSEAAAWADYDLDGDLDLYIGNEHGDGVIAPGQLFRNNGDRTFTDVARSAGVENLRFAKGATWGDFDNDGYPDLYLSNLRREANRLYRNNRDGTFTDVAPERGVTRPMVSYTAWFWDFDNDGALDLYASSYQGGVEAVAAAYLGAPAAPGAEVGCLYRGDGKGGFAEVAAANNLKRPAMVMGANFGDIDNDGWLDFYLGTGYPEYEALMPNVLYRNREGRGFADVTFAAGMGHLQKGHAVAFADLDNDGDQDVFQQMGGAFRGDGAADALYENPGFGNRWLTLKLVGSKSNRSAIGARIRLDLEEGGKRSLHRRVSSGGSFGANPLRQEIGLGKASRVAVLEIAWPAGGPRQTFRDVAADQILEITEGRDVYRVLPR